MFQLARPIEEKQIKIIFLGDDAVGKTSLIRRFAENIFRERYKPTLGVQVFTREHYEYPPDSKEHVLIYLWDIGAQELYELVRPDYYVGVSGVVYVGDLTRPETIEHINHWSNEGKNHIQYFHGWAIALNKFDAIQDTRDTDEAHIITEMSTLLPKTLVDHEKILVTSAKNNHNVTELVNCVLSQIL